MSESTFRIGFSGHQQLGDESTQEYVAFQLRELLITYQQQACQRGQALSVYSALALGADQLFINIALGLGIPVEAVVPCARYEEIFTSSEECEEYYHLLSVCKQVHRLPVQECSDDAFLTAGQWIVDHSNLVILVWNGYPAAGRGGTADTASYARFVGCPFIHVHTRLHTTKLYGELSSESRKVKAPTSRRFAVEEQTVYQGPVLTVNRYHMQMPDGKEFDRDIVEWPETC